jgi:hypothetical protein
MVIVETKKARLWLGRPLMRVCSTWLPIELE